jgi:S-DNA-T family DNA segregation ATPase FtsK/SpoIIIE
MAISSKTVELLRVATHPAAAKYSDYFSYRGRAARKPKAPAFASTAFTVGQDARASQVEAVCAAYGVSCKVVGSQSGPVISKIFVQPKTGTKASALEAIAKDLARDLDCASIEVNGNDYFQFVDPYTQLPKHRCCSIAIPVKDRKVVPFGNIFNSPAPSMAVPAVIGVTPVGTPVRIDLAKAPHMLVAGQTGSGKSVCINSIISSVYLSMPTDMVRFLLIDPKQVELKPYEALPNVINGRAITDPMEAVLSIGWLVSLMEYRYSVLARLGFRNIKDFNAAVENCEKIFTIPSGKRRKMPYIVAVVDEFADLMMTAPGELTAFVMRIAQKARAVGIHLVLATQRPSTKVVTGDLKCNIPTRIAFKVASSTDSMTILGYGGAEKLLGYGDMIVGTDGSLQRLHGCLLTDQELEAILARAAEADRMDYEDAGNFLDVNFAEPFSPVINGIPEWVKDAPAMVDLGLAGKLLQDTRSQVEILAAAKAIKMI